VLVLLRNESLAMKAGAFPISSQKTTGRGGGGVSDIADCKFSICLLSETPQKRNADKPRQSLGAHKLVDRPDQEEEQKKREWTTTIRRSPLHMEGRKR